MAESNSTANQMDIGAFTSVLAEVAPKADPTEQAERVLDNTAVYDFSFYEFLFPTETGYRGALSERALATLDDFQAAGGADFAAQMLDILTSIEHAVGNEVRRVKRRDWDEPQIVQDLLDDFYRIRD